MQPPCAKSGEILFRCSLCFARVSNRIHREVNGDTIQNGHNSATVMFCYASRFRFAGVGSSPLASAPKINMMRFMGFSHRQNLAPTSII